MVPVATRFVVKMFAVVRALDANMFPVMFKVGWLPNPLNTSVFAVI
jgi:hypothetical protein